MLRATISWGNYSLRETRKIRPRRISSRHLCFNKQLQLNPSNILKGELRQPITAIKGLTHLSPFPQKWEPHTVVIPAKVGIPTVVIPAKAGIPCQLAESLPPWDPRFRGDDKQVMLSRKKLESRVARNCLGFFATLRMTIPLDTGDFFRGFKERIWP